MSDDQHPFWQNKQADEINARAWEEIEQKERIEQIATECEKKLLEIKSQISRHQELASKGALSKKETIEIIEKIKDIVLTKN